MRISVIYDTKTGNTKKAAEFIVKGIKEVNGMDAKAFNITNVDDEYAKTSQGIIIGSPTYSAYLTARMKTWLEDNLKPLNVAGKLGGAFATANYVHGGGELTMQCILTHEMVKGMMVYSGGGAYGVPVIHLGPVALGEKLDEFEELFVIYGKRFAMQTISVFSEKN